jgi:hypothetical protein
MVKNLYNNLKDAGFEFPLLQSAGSDLLERLIDNESIDLLRWTPKIPSIDRQEFSLDYNPLELLPFYEQANAVFPFSLPVGIEGEFSLIPRLSMGVDTYALQSIREGEGRNPWELFFNSIYLNDRHESADGVIADLPELEIDLRLLAFAGLMIGKEDGFANAYAKVFGGPELHLDVDLAGSADGKLRIYDMLQTLTNVDFETGDVLGQLGENILKLINFSGNLDLQLGAEAGVNINLVPKDKSDLDAVAKALSDAYEIAAEWLNQPTDFNFNLGYDFEVPIISFDSATSSFFLNV